MGEKVTVYKQIIAGKDECLEVLKREIGMKTNCMPFASKLITAMKELTIKTEQDATNAANVLLSGLQTLAQGGILPEDYDKIDFVKRGGTIVPSARVEAFYRAAARKGYRITDTIIAVPKEDSNTTYFKENFYNGAIYYTLEDRRINPDRAVTAERLVQKYFGKFICRLEIRDARQNNIIVMTVCEMPIDDMLAVSMTSEQGLYKSKWEKYKDNYGNEKKRKVISDELNSGTFWINWTGEMVNKTIIRRALKRVKEVLPELTEAIYAFEQDEVIETPEVIPAEPVIEIPMKAADVNLNKLTPEQQEECKEMYLLFQANPKLAKDKAVEIKAMFEGGEDKQEIINREYASIMCIRKSQSLWAEIGEYFNEKS